MQPSGRLLGGRYELTALIATGGMGQVWQGRDVLLNRDVAVKVLRSEYTGDDTFLARFRAEAQLAAGLVHPDIATLFDYGEVAPGGPDEEHLAYLVMELVRGESLAARLRREVRLSPAETLAVLRHSAAGLAAAHAAGVVHRDVKPGNVLLGADGTVKITDFGVAVSLTAVPLTRTGQVIGTPHYLSPEQAEGSRATPASDVYALGVVGYECLSGHRVFDGESSVQIALAHIRQTPAPLPDDVPEPVRLLIAAAMAKDPAHRFPDGSAFRDAIDDVLAGRDSAAAHPAPPAVLGFDDAPATAEFDAVDAEPPASWTWRRRLLVPLAGLLVLGAASAGALQLVGGPTPAASGTTTTASTPAPRTSATSSAPAPTPIVQNIALTSADYIGRPVGEVQAELAASGFAVTLQPVTTTAVADGLVTAVDPVGPLTPGTPLTVSYAVAPPPAPTPTPAPLPAPAPAAADTAGAPAGPASTGSGSGSGSGTGSGNGGNGNGNSGGNGNGNGGGNGKGNGKG